MENSLAKCSSQTSERSRNAKLMYRWETDCQTLLRGFCNVKTIARPIMIIKTFPYMLNSSPNSPSTVISLEKGVGINMSEYVDMWPNFHLKVLLYVCSTPVTINIQKPWWGCYVYVLACIALATYGSRYKWVPKYNTHYYFSRILNECLLCPIKWRYVFW